MNLAELLIDENIDQVMALNADLRVTVWNKACENATGVKKEAIIGAHFFDFFPDLQSDTRVTNAIAAALQGYKSFIPHDRLIPGRQFSEQHFVPLRNDAGHVIGILNVIHDVGHRIKAESELNALNKSLENFKRIIDTAHDAIITFDVKGNITYWNESAGHIFGYNQEEIMGQSVSCLLPADKKDQLNAIMEMLQHEHIVDLVIKQLTKAGEEIDVAVNIFLLKDENNMVVGGCKIAKDITPMLRYQQSIEALNNELTIKNRQLASVNSELKTFTNIAGNNYNETLRQLYLHFEYITAHEAGKLSDPGKANIRKAQAAIQKMKLLTNDIIAFTRLNEFDTELKPVDLTYVIKTIIDDIKNNSFHAVFKLSDDLPTIMGYPFLVSLTFHHLLENAVKFRREKVQPEISISARSYVSGSEITHYAAQATTAYHVITVQDNGIGFTDTEAQDIFGIFTRLEPARYKGSGIGLAICRKAMELHGGFITTTSKPNAGSSFSCYYPVRTITSVNAIM